MFFNSSLDEALAVATIFLPALLMATLAVLARRSLRLTIRALSVGGLVTLVAGLALYDSITHFKAIQSVSLGTSDAHAYWAFGLLYSSARWLLIGALAFALWDAASHRKWWWVAGLAATLVAGIACFAALIGLPVSDLFGGLFAFSINGFGHTHTAGEERLFHIVVELLMALTYLPALLYTRRSGGTVPEEALATTIPDR